VDRFRALIEDVRHGNPSPEAQARAERVYERGLAVRDLLAEHRIRERELRALLDVASELGALHAMNDVLTAICRGARSLLGTDAAWITLVDAKCGGTYHAMTDGIVAEELVRSIRLSAGTGLGGLVLQSGNPQWTDDYLKDRRFAHTGKLDS